ncbi:MAG: arylsulfatase [Mucinivorans sp.]
MKNYELLLLSTPLLLTACQNKEIVKPNIIYILADDMGYGDVRALNVESKIPTPTIDSMIGCGMSFSDAHSNAAVSSPTRYGTLTGRYAFRSSLKNGVLVGLDSSIIEPTRPTVATFLRQNGYRTACVGKWHVGLDWQSIDSTRPLFTGDRWNINNTSNVNYSGTIGGGPMAHGFDYSFIIPGSLGMPPYTYIENDRVTAPVTTYIQAWDSGQTDGTRFRAGDAAQGFDLFSCQQTLTAKAVDYIAKAPLDKPFFLYFALAAPHAPHLPSSEFQGRSQAGPYGDFVCMVDDALAQVYRALREAGQEENTIVIFTSDNGSMWRPEHIKQYGHRSNGPFSGRKFDVLEGGHHVPYVVTWADHIHHKVSNQLVSSTDLMATCATILGTELPAGAGEDSHSFWHAITGQNGDSAARTTMIYHSNAGNFGYRSGKWALLDCRDWGGWLTPKSRQEGLAGMKLYDLSQDIAQKNDLAGQYPELVERLKTELLSQIESSFEKVKGDKAQ